MGEVISILEKRPHVSGMAKCLHCEHEWGAVAPVGTFAELECPQCGLFNGVMKGTCSPEIAWVCNCGCDVFRLSPKGVICIHCGEYQNWEPD